MMTVQQTLSLAVQEQRAGRLPEAAALYRQILSQQPDLGEAQLALARVLRDSGRNDEAIDLYHQYISRWPNDPQGYFHIGESLRAKHRWEDATAALRKALSLRPDWPEALFGLGFALQSQMLMDEAAEALRHATRLRPDFVDAQNILGNLMKDTGQLGQAIACYQSALAANPNHVQVHSNLLMTLLYCPDQNAGEIFRQQRLWDQQHAQPLRACIQPHANDPNPQRRLRLGYVSADFHKHSSAFFLDPLLRSHDHEKFEVTCYANVAEPDAVTQRFKAYADRWRNIRDVQDEQVVQQIHDDAIDILVDLKLHTANNRLLVFARKPAPVQVCWLGCPSTTGLSTMDYRLTDPYLDPPGLNDAYYSEQSIRLPDTFWCYDPLASEPAVNELPAARKGYVTFGCLNNFCKVNDGVLSLWSKVLKAVPGSRLLLSCPDGSPRQRVRERLEVDPDRLLFVAYQLRPLYLRTYHRIDLCLDTLPYNGHTTSLDALWMGVPVLALVGDRAVGRAGWSQLSNLGLQELAAHTPEQWVRLVTDLAADLPRLAQLRSTLRQRMEKSPLMDALRFARNVESAYRLMWRQWCQPRSL